MDESSPSPSNVEEKTQDSSAVTTETAKAITAQPKPTITKVSHMSEATSIMEFSEDISTAEAPPPIPAGDYPASIVKAEIKESAKGNKYLALMFKIDPDNYPADFIEGNLDGEQLSYNRVQMSDTPRGRYQLRKFLESIGAPMSRVLDPNELMGLTATVGVKHGTWEGEVRAEIGKVLSA